MFHELFNLFYPKTCQICDEILLKNERIVCLKCLHELPITNYHLYNENPVKKVFYGRVPVENATSLMIFKKKGSVQKLIHQLKYKGQQEIGFFLGTWLGTFFFFFFLKLRSRGFNQVEGFGKEIADALKIPYLDQVLLKKSFTTTQTIKERLARWGNIEETFILARPQDVKNKHVLLVDDLITTGATLEACANTLKQVGGVKISIATMAVAG